MNRKRLRILAKFLRGVKPKHFDLHEWCEINGGKIANGTIKKVGCGTTGCAIGWATSIPSFNRDGLRLSLNKGETVAALRFKRLENWDAVEEFFSLSVQEASNLFDRHHYSDKELKNPKAVAKRIEAKLAE